MQLPENLEPASNYLLIVTQNKKQQKPAGTLAGIKHMIIK
jgi:hypothetical protein